MSAGLAFALVLLVAPSDASGPPSEDPGTGGRSPLLRAQAILRPGELGRPTSPRPSLRASDPDDPGPAAGLVTPLVQEVGIANSTLSQALSQLGQATAALADGSFAVAYATGVHPDHDLRMQWIDAQGEPLFLFPGTLVAGGPADQRDAVLAPHPVAGVFVAFKDDTTIRVQYFDGNGAAQWPGSGVAVALLPATAYASQPHVIAGAAIAYGQATGWIHDPGAFFSLTPCRVLDTRDPAGSYGGPALAAGQSRTFAVAGRCGIPASARAVAVNLTVTGSTAQGNLTLFPAGQPAPLASTLNYATGLTRANNAVVGLSPAGALAIRCTQASGGSHVILDVAGYFE